MFLADGTITVIPWKTFFEICGSFGLTILGGSHGAALWACPRSALEHFQMLTEPRPGIQYHQWSSAFVQSHYFYQAVAQLLALP